MKIVAINAAWRKNGTTTQFVNEALQGAASQGVETEMIRLAEADIRPCTDCLACYREQTSDLGPCSIADDMTALLQKVTEADGIILATPVHNAFVNGLMATFFERMVWRLCIPTRKIAFFNNCPNPRTSKVRALSVMVSTGGMPARVKRFLPVMAWLKSNGMDYFNAHWVGDFFGESQLAKMPESEEEWRNIYFLRKVSRSQLDDCRKLGIKMACVMKSGSMKPTAYNGPIANAVMGFLFGRGRIYRVAD